MSSTAKWVIGIVGVLVLLFGLFMVLLFSWFISDEDETTVGSNSSGDKVALIQLRETILSSEDIVRQFKKYRDNRAIRAIVFRVESPGGGVAASQEIYEEVKKTRDSGKPVVVSMGSVAASGGYYVACGASRIVANPGTITGSIGVIMQFIHVTELMKKLGIDESTIKTGKFKDTGSPFRKVLPEERAYFDLLIGDVYEQFVDVVAVERKLERGYVKRYADGRVFTGRQAQKLGFVDTLGTMEDAIMIAAKLARIDGKPSIVKEVKRATFMERMFGDAAATLTRVREEFLAQPILQYKLASPY